MLSKFSVKKPLTVVVILIIIVILGVVSYTSIGLDLMPSMNIPYMVVATIYPGQAPDVIEKEITIPVERELAKIGGIKTMQSQSMEHVSIIILELNASTDVNKAYQEISAGLKFVSFPESDLLQDPMVIKLDPTMMPIMKVSLGHKDHSAKDKAYYDKIIEKINAVDGVATVSTSGVIGNYAFINIDTDNIGTYITEFVKGLLNLDTIVPEARIKQFQTFLRANIGGKGADEISDMLLDFVLSSVPAGVPVDKATIKSNKQVTGRLSNMSNAIIADIYMLNDDPDCYAVFHAYVDGLMDGVVGGIAGGFASPMLGGGLPTNMFGQLLMAQNMNMPVGSVAIGASSMMVKVGDEIKTRDELLNLPIFTLNMADTLSDYVGQLETVLSLISRSPNAGIVKIGADTLNQGLAYIAMINAMGGLDAFLPSVPPQYAGALRTLANLIDLGNVRTVDDLTAPLHRLETINASLHKDQGGNLPSDYKPAVTWDNADADGNPTPLSNYFINFLVINKTIQESRSLLTLTIRMSAIGNISFLDDSGSQITKLYKREGSALVETAAIQLSLEKEPDKSTATVTSAVKALLTKMEKEDSGFKATVLSDDGNYIKFMVDAVVSNLLYGALFAAIVLLIFLKQIKATLIVSSSIIFSVIGTFVMMYFAGLTLNMLSMGGLALGVGMLVDNSVVVLENIYRMKSQGKNIYAAAIQGAKQVAGAVIASTLTTVIVFLPIAFIDGLTKQIFTDLALTICFSLASSLIVALTLVPMAATTILKKPPKPEGKIMTGIKRGYAKILNASLNKKWISLVVVGVLFAGTVIVALNMKTEFFPNIDGSSFGINCSINTYYIDERNSFLDGGVKAVFDEEYYTTETAVADSADILKGVLAKYPDVLSVGINYGSTGMSIAGMSLGGKQLSATVMIKENGKRDKKYKTIGDLRNAITADIKKAIRRDVDNQTKKNPAFGLDRLGNEKENVMSGLFRYSLNSNSMMDIMSSLGSDNIDLVIYGSDIDDMRKASADLKDRLEKINGVAAVTGDFASGEKEYKLIVDKTKANGYGLTVGQVVRQLMAYLSEPSSLQTLRVKDEDAFDEAKHTDISYPKQNVDVYLYDESYRVSSWYRGYELSEDEGASDTATRIHFVNNTQKIGDKDNEYFVLNTAENNNYFGEGSGANIVTGKKSDGTPDPSVITVVEKGGKIPLEPIYNAKGATIGFGFTQAVWKWVDRDNHSLGGTMEYHETTYAVPSFLEYKSNPRTPVDIPMIRLKSENALDPSAESVSFYLYEILTNDSFKKDGAGNVLMIQRDGLLGPWTPAEIETREGYRSINHIGSARTVSLSVKATDDADLKAVQKDIDKLIADFNARPDWQAVEQSVDYDKGLGILDEVFNTLYLVLALAIVLIYLVMVAQFQSFKSPFIILFTIPLAFTGSILLLWIAGMKLSVMALVGLIILVGVVVNNGIVFVDYANKLIERGVPKREALLRTGIDRLRPILMTALTTIMAMFIMAIDGSAGGKVLQPLAVATIGGLTYATVLTLTIVPMMFDIFNPKAKASKRTMAMRDKDIDTVTGDDVDDEIAPEVREMIAEVMGTKLIPATTTVPVEAPKVEDAPTPPPPEEK